MEDAPAGGDGGDGDGAAAACSDDAPCEGEDEMCVGYKWASEDDAAEDYAAMDDAAREAQEADSPSACMTADACADAEDVVVTGNTFSADCFAMRNAVALSAAALALASTM